MTPSKTTPPFVRRELCPELRRELRRELNDDDDDDRTWSVYHLSDIHIRVLERHDEYREVFDRLFESLRDKAVDHPGVIVVTGDIFHCRGKLLSETILLFDYFIEGLTSIMATIVIPGNHDLYAHSHRLDVIFGMVNAKKYENFWYLSEPGVYRYRDIDFVYLTEDRFLSADSIDAMAVEEGEAGLGHFARSKVCLFHGMVKGSTLENGMGISTGIPLSDFDGYDLVLLGDIHKYQLLAPNAGYAGSLIQQNHKETIDGHGYIWWRRSNNGGGSPDTAGVFFGSEFCPVKNDYAFIRIRDYVTTMDIAELVQLYAPKKVRVKFIIGEDRLTWDDNVKEMETSIKASLKAHGIEVIAFTKEMETTTTRDRKDPTTANQDLSSSNDGGVPAPLSEEEAIETLLQEFTGTNYDKTILHEILDHHRQQLAELEADPKTETQQFPYRPWTLDRLEFQNILAYGGDVVNTIDFGARQGSVGILGNNAIGKTCILNVILYALFGTVSKTKGASKNIINKQCKDTFVRLTIKVLDTSEKYVLVRQAKKRKRAGVDGIEETLTFAWKNDVTGESLKLNGETKLKTQDLIKARLGLGDLSAFGMTNIISNDVVHANSFVSMTSSELEGIFRNVFDLTRYKTLEQRSSKALKALAKVRDSLFGERAALSNSAKVEKAPGGLEAAISYLMSAVKVSQDNLVKLRTAQSELQKQLGRLQKVAWPSDLKTLKGVDPGCPPKRVLQQLHGNLYKARKEMQTHAGFIEDTEPKSNTQIHQELATLNVELSRLPPPPPGSLAGLSSSGTSIEELQALLDGLQIKPMSLPPSGNEQRAKEVLSKPVVQSFEKALAFTKEWVKATKAAVADRNAVTVGAPVALVSEVANLIDVLDSHIESVVDIQKAKHFLAVTKRNDEIKEENRRIQLEREKLRGQVATIKLARKNALEAVLRLRATKETLADIQRDIALTQVADKNHSQVASTEEQLKSIGEQITSETEVLAANQRKLGEFEYALDQSETASRRVAEIEEELKASHDQVATWVMYRRLMDDAGLPQLFLKTTIAAVERTVNAILFKMVGFGMSFTFQDGKWSLSIHKDGHVLGTEQCSGYERFILNVAVKIALDKYKCASGIRMLFIDECWDCVSQENLDRVEDLLEALKAYYTHVLVISHNEELKTKVDHLVDIEVVNNAKGIFSRIR